MKLQTLLFQTVMDTEAGCSDVIEKLGMCFSVLCAFSADMCCLLLTWLRGMIFCLLKNCTVCLQ